jgi:hypothetical protein
VTRSAREELDEAYRLVEHELPERPARLLERLHSSRARWLRLGIGLTLILLSPLWFLPIIGIEWLPLGLLLIAPDVPFLRKPVARFVVWADARWISLSQRWRRTNS